MPSDDNPTERLREAGVAPTYSGWSMRPNCLTPPKCIISRI